MVLPVIHVDVDTWSLLRILLKRSIALYLYTLY